MSRGEQRGAAEAHGRGEVVSMREAVGGFLRASGLGARMRHLPVYQAWSEALGVDLARRAKPVRFEKGELVVEVDSAAHFQELSSFTGESYRERANARLEKPEIQRLTFRLRR